MTTKTATLTDEQIAANIAAGEKWNKQYDYEGLSAGLFDALVDAGLDGLSMDEIAEQLDVPDHVARRTVAYMRKAFAGDHDVNVIPRNVGRERRYVLTRDMAIAAPRLDARLRMFASNFETEIDLLSSFAVGLDRSTEDGQEVHRLLKMMGRLREDVSDVLARRESAAARA